jgi:hypothetical protein
MAGPPGPAFVRTLAPKAVDPGRLNLIIPNGVTGYSERRLIVRALTELSVERSGGGLFRVWKSCEWRFGRDPGKSNDGLGINGDWE